MKTISDEMKSLLQAHGLSESEVEAILLRYTSDRIGSSMQGRMNDPLRDYPPSLHVIVWMGVKSVALKYIKETCPDAWFRSLFEDQPKV